MSVHPLCLEGELIPTNVVNLDALIKRQDFAAAEDVQSEQIDKISISHLRKGEFFYNALRKPDFQRETANWTPVKIADFVSTLLNQELELTRFGGQWRSGESEGEPRCPMGASLLQ
jgi:hypothetical protein